MEKKKVVYSVEAERSRRARIETLSSLEAVSKSFRTLRRAVLVLWAALQAD